MPPVASAGHSGPRALGRGRLRDIVRDYVVEYLAPDDWVLAIDETGFLKQGKSSCGIALQYTGSAGKITNCQFGVFSLCVRSRSRLYRSSFVLAQELNWRSCAACRDLCP